MHRTWAASGRWQTNLVGCSVSIRLKGWELAYPHATLIQLVRDLPQGEPRLSAATGVASPTTLAPSPPQQRSRLTWTNPKRDTLSPWSGKVAKGARSSSFAHPARARLHTRPA
jgi:hypothetical protein